MERILGYGPHAARERMRVARALVRLPATTASLVRGELSYSAARELTRVVTDLDVHHIVYQSHGGGHDPSNIILLCSGHHAALHAGLLTVKGEAPYLVEFRWTFGGPVPLGLDPAARSALITQQIDQIFEQLERNQAAVAEAASSAGRPRRPVSKVGEAVPPETLNAAQRGSFPRGTSSEAEVIQSHAGHRAKRR